MEERRMRTDDKPQSVVYEHLMAAAYQEHPYRRPIIGWMNDLQNMTAQDARDWYARWYAPNNATLVVAGDVQADAVIGAGKALFRRAAGTATAAAQAADGARTGRDQASGGEGARQAALSPDGLARARAARLAERLGTLCAVDSGRRVERQ